MYSTLRSSQFKNRPAMPGVPTRRLPIPPLLVPIVVLAVLLLPGGMAEAQPNPTSLRDAKKGFETKILTKVRETERLSKPPAEVFSLITYPSDVGELAAYLSRPPTDAKSAGKKHPAIIWITGGLPPGGIGAGAWAYVPRSNEQSAKAFRHAGVLMMYPTFRGANGNPGVQEYFYGEVDDVVAAAKYLSKLDYVDKKRIYLGGHSSGGTLALLAAASTKGFRAVFAFGPIGNLEDYQLEDIPFAQTPKEFRLRSPIEHLDKIYKPTFVIEGENGSSEALHEMDSVNRNSRVKFIQIDGANHFDLLAPLNDLIAKRIMEDAESGKFRLTARDLQDAFDTELVVARESSDLNILARLRRAGVQLTEQEATHYIYSDEFSSLGIASQELKQAGYSVSKMTVEKDRDGDKYYEIQLTEVVDLSQLRAVFQLSKAITKITRKHELDYGGWTVKQASESK